VFNAGMGQYGAIYIGLWVMASLTAFLTAFYMFRLTLTTFHGTFKLPKILKGAENAEKYLHESPSNMTIPLWVLAILALLGGFMGVPDFFVTSFGIDAHINWLHGWLDGVTSDVPLVLSYPVKWILVAMAIAVAVIATMFAYRKYDDDAGAATDAAIKERFGSFYQVWTEKYNFDEAYERVVINPVAYVSDKVLAVFDIKVVDGIVNAIGGTVRFFGSLLRFMQTGVVQTYAIFYIIGVILILSLLIF